MKKMRQITKDAKDISCFLVYLPLVLIAPKTFAPKE